MYQLAVVMSVYNEHEDDLIHSIESIINQDYKDFEFIIVLDNPGNNSLRKILEYYKQKDNRINLIINNNNIGLANSLNKAIRVANSDIVARMDADDIAMPDRLGKELKFLIDNPKYSVVSVNKINIDSNGNTISYGGKLPSNFETTKKAIKYISMVLHPGAMFYKKTFECIGEYRNFPCAQDYDLWLRFIDNGYQIGFLDEYLMKYRVSNISISSRKAFTQWLCNKYIRMLNIERQKTNGQDSFSETNLQQFLDENGANNLEKSETFYLAKQSFDNCRFEFKNKHYLKSLVHFFKAIQNMMIRDMLVCTLFYKLHLLADK